MACQRQPHRKVTADGAGAENTNAHQDGFRLEFAIFHEFIPLVKLLQRVGGGAMTLPRPLKCRILLAAAGSVIPGNQTRMSED
jgi:hypothetical protein